MLGATGYYREVGGGKIYNPLIVLVIISASGC